MLGVGNISIKKQAGGIQFDISLHLGRRGSYFGSLSRDGPLVTLLLVLSWIGRVDYQRLPSRAAAASVGGPAAAVAAAAAAAAAAAGIHVPASAVREISENIRSDDSAQYM